jgi:hypothetical protein
MFSPKALEAWFTLMAEAMRGTKEAQEAFHTLAEMSNEPEAVRHWMMKFMPAAVSPESPPGIVEEQIEEWWRMMGMVPRSRYLELLEKCDLLQRRLDRAKGTIQRLRAKLGNQEKQEEEARKAGEMWNTMIEETLKAQMEWVKAWTASDTQTAPEPDKQEDTTGDGTDPGT